MLHNYKLLPLWISFKFIQHQNKSNHVKVISLTTIIGLSLGVASLITVLSIMNGFSSIAKSRLSNIIPHISVNLDLPIYPSNSDTETKNSQFTDSKKADYLTRIKEYDLGSNKIKNIYPNIRKQAFIINDKQLIPILINAIPNEIIQQKLQALNPKSNKELNTKYNTANNGIILSKSIIEKLNNKNNISFITSENFVKYYNLNITDSFNASDQILGNMAFIDLDYAQDLFNDNKITTLNIELNSPDSANYYSNILRRSIPVEVHSWMQFAGNYFNILTYTKQIMFILLSCIIIVAMFNLIATLTTALKEKQSELAILKTLGIDRKFIYKLFFCYGFIITTIGLIIGLILGILLSQNIGYLSSVLENIIGYKFVNPEMYFVDYLPSKINNADLFNIVTFVYTVMLLSVIYPSYVAAKIMPAKALRYE